MDEQKRLAWQTRTRNYADEKLLETKPATEHPLKNLIQKQAVAESSGSNATSKSKSSEPAVLDPLSRLAQENLQLGGSATSTDFDPLSALSGSSSFASNPLEPTKARSGSGVAPVGLMLAQSGAKKLPVVTVADELWSAKRSQVLNTYTTREKIAIRTAVLSAKDNIHEVVIQAEKLKPTDRVEQRLAELNEFDETTKNECVSVTVEEYLAKIADVNSNLTAAWRDEQRVKAVRLAIQCAKMLNDTSVIEFYPSKFVLITDILDNFGNLVFDRLRAKAESVGRQLPDDFKCADVPNAAKETTLNWFYKLASIRELLPRIYMQAAILQSLRFISDKPLDEWLEELMMMTRGIANPLVSLYTSAYLCRVGLRAYFQQKAYGGKPAPTKKQANGTQGGGAFSSTGDCLPLYLRNCIDDFLLISRQLNRLNFDHLPKDDNITLTSYVRLFIPAMEWIFQCVSSFAANANASSLLAIDILRASDGHPNSDLIIQCLLSTFPTSFVLEMALPIASALSSIKKPDIPKWQLFKALALALLNCDPLFSNRKNIFDVAWSSAVVQMVSSTEATTKDVLSSSEVWLEYAGKFLELAEADTVMAFVVETCSKAKESAESYSQILQSSLSKFIHHVKDFAALLTLPHFNKFLDCFGKGSSSVKADACRVIIEAYRKTTPAVVSDQVFIDSMMFLCKQWHDSSVSYHSSADITRQMSKSVNAFISRVDFGRDFEKLLQFYMDCRSTFVFLEEVVVHLILMVNRAVMNVRSIVNGVHSKRTLNFAKASIAYCYITIPSIGDPFKQLRLSILTAQTALVNGGIGQSEALFKLAVTTLTEVPTSVLGTDGRQHPTDTLFSEIVSQLCAALIPLPDSPEQAALYIWQGVLNATLRYDWQAAAAVPGAAPPLQGLSSSSPRIDALLSILSALAALSQSKYIYTVDSVDANDVLYGSDARFIARVNELAVEILTAIVADIEERASSVLPPKKASSQAISSHQNIVAFIASSILPAVDLNNPECLRLANRLWELGGSNNQSLLKLKSILFAQKASFAEQLFSSAAS